MMERFAGATYYSVVTVCNRRGNLRWLNFRIKTHYFFYVFDYGINTGFSFDGFLFRFFFDFQG